MFIQLNTDCGARVTEVLTVLQEGELAGVLPRWAGDALGERAERSVSENSRSASVRSPDGRREVYWYRHGLVRRLIS